MIHNMIPIEKYWMNIVKLDLKMVCSLYIGFQEIRKVDNKLIVILIILIINKVNMKKNVLIQCFSNFKKMKNINVIKIWFIKVKLIPWSN